MRQLRSSLRALSLSALVSLVPAVAATAQQTAPAAAAPPRAAADTAPVPRPASPATGASVGFFARVSSRIREQIELLGLSHGTHIPPVDSFSVGPRLVPGGSIVHGSIGVRDGELDVAGRVEGDAVALRGDVVVHRGGVVTGDALAADGRVILDGGRVDGKVKSLAELPRYTARTSIARPPLTTWQSVKLVLGWFAILLIIGIGVMIFAEPNLDGVVSMIELGSGRAFWFGVLAEIVALPVLLLLTIGLTITIIGVLLVPFALVVYPIAVMGLLTLGFLAVARLTGGVLVRPRDGRPARAQHLGALFAGLVVYLGLWLLAAAFTWQPVAGALLRGIALGVTWVAATVGLGAALVSRGGTQSGTAHPAKTSRAAVADELAWQTPTPVTGVAAARRKPAVSVGEAP